MDRFKKWGKVMVIRKENAICEENGGLCRLHYVDQAMGAGSVSLGMVTLQPGCELKPHYHLVEDAMLVVAGSGEFVLNGEATAVCAGTAVLAPAGSVHYLRNSGTEPFTLVYAWPSVNVQKF